MNYYLISILLLKQKRIKQLRSKFKQNFNNKYFIIFKLNQLIGRKANKLLLLITLFLLFSLYFHHQKYTTLGNI